MQSSGLDFSLPDIFSFKQTSVAKKAVFESDSLGFLNLLN